MEETYHITDTVHRTHHLLLQTIHTVLTVSKEFDRMWLIKMVEDGILIAVILGIKIFVCSRCLGYILDEVRNLLMRAVAPRIHASPMVVETFLENLHLLVHRPLCVCLHTSVDSSVYLQSVTIQVNIICLTPITKILPYSKTEILCLSIVGILHLIVGDIDWYLYE